MIIHKFCTELYWDNAGLKFQFLVMVVLLALGLFSSNCLLLCYCMENGEEWTALR